MKVGLIGGTGFVGSYLTDGLLRAGHEPSLLVRPGSEDKVSGSGGVRIVSGDLDSASAIGEVLAGCDAAVYNVGILREFPRRGITFEQSQYEGAARTVDAARESGVRRFLLMSANGVKRPGTPYQETKHRAEEYAFESGLDVTVMRPSVIFGDPRGRMEFATQLCNEMVRPPLPAVEFFRRGEAGREPIVMSPVHIDDVTAAFVAALDDDTTIGKVYELGGPEVLTWREMLDRIAAAAGKRKIVLPMPTWVMRTGATMFDWLPFFPVTRGQLTMLEEGNTADPDVLAGLIGRQPRPFSIENLAYLAR